MQRLAPTAAGAKIGGAGRNARPRPSPTRASAPRSPAAPGSPDDLLVELRLLLRRSLGLPSSPAGALHTKEPEARHHCQYRLLFTLFCFPADLGAAD